MCKVDNGKPIFPVEVLYWVKEMVINSFAITFIRTAVYTISELYVASFVVIFNIKLLSAFVCEQIV